MNGFNRWVKTWTADYVSVQEIYWNVPGSDIDVTRLPRRAFDSEQQRDRTSELFADYNHEHDMTPELDERFAALAAERVHAAPLRYYLWLPAERIADMWLRPRTELLPSDPRWWEFNDDGRWLTVSLDFRPDQSGLRRRWRRAVCGVSANFLASAYSFYFLCSAPRSSVPWRTLSPVTHWNATPWSFLWGLRYFTEFDRSGVFQNVNRCYVKAHLLTLLKR